MINKNIILNNIILLSAKECISIKGKIVILQSKSH